MGLLLWGGGAAGLLSAANVRFKQRVGWAGTTDPPLSLRKYADQP